MKFLGSLSALEFGGKNIFARILCVFALCVCSAPASAQFCNPQQSTPVTFAGVSPDQPTDATGSVPVICQSPTAGYLRYCIYVPSGSPITGIAPRWMTNWNGAQAMYDLYSDPARTLIIGPPPSGGSFPIYTSTLLLPAAHTPVSVNVPIYGRVPAGQSLPATLPFTSQISGAQFSWAFSTSGYPPSCNAGQVARSDAFYLNVDATVASGCRIALANDLDFGSTSSLAAKKDVTSSIVVRCPLNTNWALGLDDGANALLALRRMRGSNAGGLVRYEIYKDSLYTQRWGNSGTDRVTGKGAGESTPINAKVYGRLPAQATALPDVYSDTVIVTLTY